MGQNSVASKRFQLIETIKGADIVGAGQRLYFQDQPQLKSMGNKIVQVLQIAAYCFVDFPAAPSGRAVSTVAQFKNAFLVLNVLGTENFLYIPLAQLRATHDNAADGGPHAIFPFQLLQIAAIDWTKSYYQFAADPTNAVYSYMLGVWYVNLPEDLTPLQGYQSVTLI